MPMSFFNDLDPKMFYFHLLRLYSEILSSIDEVFGEEKSTSISSVTDITLHGLTDFLTQNPEKIYQTH